MKNDELLYAQSDDNLSYVVVVISPSDDHGANVTARPFWARTRTEQVADISVTVAEHCSKYLRGVSITVTEIAN